MAGGVCAVLDYEVELMAEYVAEMSMRVVLPNITVTQSYRKFVSQILNSTRLPSTTILLGLNYLAKRVNNLKARQTFNPTEGEAWRMLTVSLLLGSKFLDDNTFQNRSWSEVSGIRVQDLNRTEIDWVLDIDWCLYVNMDKSDDFKAWLANWKDWQTGRKQEQAARQEQRTQAALRERISQPLPQIRIDTRVAGYSHNKINNSSNAFERLSPEGMSDHDRLRLARAATAAKNYRPQENANWYSSWNATPVTPPDSGYSTPEYYNSTAAENWYDDRYRSNNYTRPTYQNTPHGHSYDPRASNYHQSSFYSHYSSSKIWESGGGDCTCSNCMATLHKPSNYFSHHGYGQSVMG